MFVITKRDKEDLNTQIVQGFGDEQTDAAVVFTCEDRAQKYLADSDRADQEILAELPGAANLAFLARLADESVDQLLVDPLWSNEEETLKDFGVIQLPALIQRMTNSLENELSQATALPMSDGASFIYHCQNCSAIEHRDKKEPVECCGHPMVLGAASNA